MAAGETEPARGLGLNPSRVGKSAGDERPLEVLELGAKVSVGPGYGARQRERRQIPYVDARAPRQDRRPLQEIAQLADVPGEVVRLESRDGLGRDRPRRQP